jgi:hypothetical protein
LLDQIQLSGAGLQVIRHHYFRGDSGVYRFGWEIKSGIKAKRSRISYLELIPTPRLQEPVFAEIRNSEHSSEVRRC